MSYGLEPTQMDEWRKKHRFRFFLEERLLELRDIFTFSVRTSTKGLSYARKLPVEAATDPDLWTFLVVGGLVVFVMLY